MIILSSKTGTMKAVLFTSRIVETLYRNWLHVCHWFGPSLSFAWSEGFAVPFVSTLSFEMCLALASIAALTISLS